MIAGGQLLSHSHRRMASCPVLSRLVLSCLALSCLGLSCIDLSCLVLSCLVLSCLTRSLCICLERRIRTYAKTTRIPELNEPVRQKRPHALRYPLPASEIADGELIQIGGDTLQTSANLDRNEKGRSKALSFAMRKRVPERSQPVKKPRPSIADAEEVQSVVDTLQAKSDLDRNEKGRSKALSFAMRKRVPERSQPVKKPRPSVRRYPILGTYIADEEKVQSVVDTLQAKSDMDRNERERAKALSYAMRKRVAEMAHCQDVIESLQGGMHAHARSRDHKRHRYKRISRTWMDHFLQHHSLWLQNRNVGMESFHGTVSKRYNVFNSAGNQGRAGNDGFPGGCKMCRADGAVYVPNDIYDTRDHLVSLFGVALGRSLHMNHTTTLTITFKKHNLF